MRAAVATPVGPWVEALDDFERRLEVFHQVLEHDAEPIGSPWPPPEVTGLPLPPELAPRARDLLGRAAGLEEAMRLRREDLHLRAAFGPRYHRTFPGRPSVSTDL
ncbi:MAG: hypothetical protein OEY41_10730 [Acidimicrobiia bacterium]|nr:hypothetical protein [Acidimicrobiia bacterium]